MNRFIGAGLVLSASVLVPSVWSGREPGQPAASAEDTFLRRVQPLLKQKCLGCHGDDAKLRGNLDLRTRQAMLKGGDSGPALVPGDPERSLLYQAVLHTSDLKMPPKKEAQLTPAETTSLKDWIAAGAPWPAPRTVATEAKGWKADPKDAWAFRPVSTPAIPAAAANDPHARTPIDAFILEQLRRKGLQPAPPADRVTLLRRATFGLTGLPPTPEEIDAFVNDPASDAFERVVERLLASPRYGEHWSRHWLDVVRYSDTSGYSNDYERPNAWRYRDYVIRSFNEDRPYDRFILEQLAGDELAPKDADALIGVGYLRMGPWEQTGMSVAAVTRQLFLDDVTNAVGTTFLALPLSCCRCHDHKFDPLPTRDYYRVQAVFAPAQFEERPVPFLACENIAGAEQAAARVQERIRRNEERLKTLNPKDKGVQEELRRAYRKRLQYYQLEAKRYQPLAFSVSSGGLEKPVPAPETHILVGGSLSSPGAKVTPGVLSAVHGSDDATPNSWNTVPITTAGRRLALARWIASAKNPLTARVMVNRIWQYHFGKGLVETSNTFGKMGKRPAHPALLDWLATEFIRSGWSVKAMHRLILRSAVYQRSGRHPDLARVREADPLNQLLAYFPPRRLTAEELRDSVLAVSGELSHTAGGPPVFPEINRDVALQPRQVMGALAPIYEPSPRRAQRNRRTIYTVQMRTLANPFLEVFNAAGMDTSCERRDESTVTPQVFALFNSQFTHDMALAMARRLERLSADRGGQIEWAFRLAHGRLPTARERQLCLAHRDRMREHHRKVQPVREELPKQIVRGRIAEFSGTHVQIVEDWDPAGYEPNLKPWDVPAETRALAEVCLVLLNSNEFIYLH